MSNEELRELSHQCDLAAYAVLGTARVLFAMVNDEKLRQRGLEAIAEYDRRRKVLEQAQHEASAA